MGFGPKRVGFFGHGIGLELDELPVIGRGAKEVLATGMVVAIEPKIVFPGVGAVGIEDTMVVEGAEGARYLSLSPRNPIIVG
jgi:Xaa-Pro aminopeptidase